MKHHDFIAYKNTQLERFQRILGANPAGDCDEQGLPAYTNPNPLMRWLTWKRVNIILNAIEQRGEMKNVLDFGCGYGVFLPYLIEHAERTTAFDLIIEKVKIAGEREGWQKIEYVSDFSQIASRKEHYDLILAIEVMEHVKDLDGTINTFADILAPGGHLLVSGPTENFLYKLGRKLAGYSGEYHVRNIYHIRAALEKRFKVKKVATLLPFLPFYEVYSCKKEFSK